MPKITYINHGIKNLKPLNMRFIKHLTISLLILFLAAGCGKITRMHQKAYDSSEAGNYQGALELYEQITTEKPEDPLILNDYGWTLFMADSLQAAVEKLEMAKNKSNNGGSILTRNIEKNLHIANSYIKVKQQLQEGNPEKAKEVMDELEKSWKPREMRLKYYALVYESMGEETQANEYWQRVLDFYPDDGIRNHFQKLASNRIRQ